MYKALQKFSQLEYILILTFVFAVTLSSYFFSSMSNLAYAQLQGCGEIDVGSPGNNQQPPAQCQESGGGNQSVVELAKKHLAGSYIWAAPSPRVWSAWNPNTGHAPIHFDCSGFAGWVWYWATNGKVNLPGQTDAVWNYTKQLSGSAMTLTRVIGKEGIQPGDLVYFGSVATTHHVGIYEGSGGCGHSDCFLEWYSSGKPGRESYLEYDGDYVGYVHIVVH
jgi:cell wall-associated NlpC family hydrolase